jgi:site-specific recombinase XerD
MNQYRKISYTLVFNRLKRLNAKGQAVIQIRCYQKGRTARYFSTGVYLTPNYWDAKKRKVKHTYPLSYDLNKMIREQMECIESFEIEMIKRSSNRFFPIEQLHLYQAQQKEIVSFTDFYENEMKLSTIQPQSLKPQRTTFNKLKDYHKEVFFEDINLTFVQGFDKYLRNLGLHPNTVNRHHKHIKKYLSLAVTKQYFNSDRSPYLTFKAKRVESEREFLSEVELERIAALKFEGSEQRLDKIRDFILLACYTGLRFSDVVKLTPNHFEETKEGLVMTYQATKTKRYGRTPLYCLFLDENGESKAEKLVKRILVERKKKANDDAFNSIPLLKITNQYLNRQLKIIAKKAGINKRVTAHIGRRTFTTILFAKGVQQKAIQQLLQHTTIQMTMVYNQMNSNVVEVELKKVNW